jgi:hypothetical protein
MRNSYPFPESMKLKSEEALGIAADELLSITNFPFDEESAT